VSVIARRILATNAKGDHPVSWLDWLNRPETLESHAFEYRGSDTSSPESLDISTNRVIVCSRVQSLDAFGCNIPTGKSVVVYNLGSSVASVLFSSSRMNRNEPCEKCC
jgi:hypothetical protein